MEVVAAKGQNVGLELDLLVVQVRVGDVLFLLHTYAV